MLTVCWFFSFYVK